MTCRITSATDFCSALKMLKSKPDTLTEWQGHLLSCLVQLDIGWAILIMRQLKIWGLPSSLLLWGRQYWDCYVLILMRLYLFHSHEVQIAMFQLSEGWDYTFLILRRSSLQFSILRRLRLHFLILRTLRLQTSEVSSSWKTNCSEEITKCSLTVASWISWWWWWWMMITRPSAQCKFCFFLHDRYRVFFLTGPLLLMHG